MRLLDLELRESYWDDDTWKDKKGELRKKYFASPHLIMSHLSILGQKIIHINQILMIHSRNDIYIIKQ